MRRLLKKRARPVPPNVLLGILFVGLVVLLGCLAYKQFTQPVKVTDFDSCVKAGNPILESFPEQCVHNGQSFINPSQNIPKPF